MLNVVIMFGRRYTPLRGFLLSVVILHHYSRSTLYAAERKNLFLTRAGNNALPGKDLLPQLRSSNISFRQVKVNS